MLFLPLASWGFCIQTTVMHNAKEAAQLVKTRQKTVAVTEAARVKRLAGNVVTNRKELEHLQSDVS